MSQPIVPVLLYFYDWKIVIGSVMGLVLIWAVLVAPLWISPTLLSVGPWFVRLKFIAVPLMAWLLWHGDHIYLALLALTWPLLGPMVTQPIAILPRALLMSTRLGQSSQIGVVQSRILVAIGMQPQKAEV
jgi:hypothetical protein